MNYFTTTDHTAYRAGQVASFEGQSAQDKMLNLHRALHERMRAHDWDLHPHWQKSRILTSTSAATLAPADVLTLTYFRSVDQAQLVENLMGIDTHTNHHVINVDPYRHPVIELRLGYDHFAIELILSRSAWWDQQNFIGKLELDRHRTTLRNLLRSMSNDYCFGFWDGTQFSEMHLTTWQLAQSRIMNEWLDTFADGQDWLRFGVWYDPNDPALYASNIVGEAFRRMSDLYVLYDFMLWTSNNNYRSFYEKRERYSRRLYA